jgi:hypothetical protein
METTGFLGHPPWEGEALDETLLADLITGCRLPLQAGDDDL